MPNRETTRRAGIGVAAEGAATAGIVRVAERLRHRLAREAPVAATLFRRLDRNGAGGRRAGRRYRLFAFCDRLIAESKQAVFEEPQRALDLARWAADLAGQLDPGRYGEALIYDLRGRAWGRIGNALRVLGDHRQAEAAFHDARALLDQGSGDLLANTELIDLLASLRRSHGNYKEALRLLARAIANYRRLNDSHRAGRALIKSGTIRGDAGDFARAIAEITTGLKQIDADDEPRLVLAARHNLAIYHYESGRTEIARDLLTTEAASAAADGSWARLSRRWVEGVIAHRERRLAEAESAYVEARAGFIEKGLPYDTAQVSLNLATLYADQGRSREMKRLAAEMIPIFRSCEVDRETLAALMIFGRAAEMETVTLRMLNDLAAGLDRTSAATRRRSDRRS
jgi:tetratricopeptide (TPR) repeat protein